MASIDLSQKPPSLLDIFCRELFEICIYAKRILTSNAYITKISKIPFSILKEKGFLSVNIIDNSCLQGDDYDDFFCNYLSTIEFFRSLRFTIHPDKSKFIPTRCIT